MSEKRWQGTSDMSENAERAVPSEAMLAGASADDLNAALIARAMERGAAAIARAEASLAGLQRNQRARVREWGRLLVRRARQASSAHEDEGRSDADE
ncbi:MAG: hypothetical protein M0R74_10630 [Dehalococcoidia bacterium]|nr:hypothetical protein [Dehalococcoidia bacterium]